MFGLRGLAVTAGAVCGLTGTAFGVLTGQSRLARAVIGVPKDLPLNADGVYEPDGSGPVPPAAHTGATPLRFAVFGDSSAAGLGVDDPDHLPGVVLARGLAQDLHRPVHLVSYAVSGSTSPALAAQLDRVTEPPEVSLVIIGANDVTKRVPIASSAARLSEAVHRLRAAGSAVVVGTCVDLGMIRPIQQPLRGIVSHWSRALARAQHRVAVRSGAIAVPLADLLSPEFFARPHDLFSADRFHPNAHGYRVAAAVLLGPLCAAARLAGTALGQHATAA